MGVEFKSDTRSPLSDGAIYDEVVALANTEGGVLLIGVEDNSSVTGASPRHGDHTDPLKLQSAIFNNTVPGINTRVSVVGCPDGDVVAIEVDRYPVTCATKQGKCLRRSLREPGHPETIPYYPHEHTKRGSDLGLTDFSAQSADGATWDDLDPLQFERLRQTITRLGGEARLLELSDQDCAKALRLVETGAGGLVPNYAGLLLLGRESSLGRFLPTHSVRYQVIDDRGNVRANDNLRGPVLQVVEQVDERFRARNEEREVLVGMVRVAVPDYAPAGFREAVLNAVLHRQYAENQPVHIQWHADHMLITSPGGFPEGINKDNVLTHEPKPRSPRLAEACGRIGLVEQVARGVDKIYLGQLAYGRPVPDYSRTDATGVRLVLWGGPGSLEFAAFVYEQDRLQASLALDEMLVLNALLQERRIDSSVAAGLMQKGVPEARGVLELLVERGLLEATGERKGRAYHLAASLYRRLGEPGGYVRAHGIDPIRQEAMVLEYVRAHGRAARSDVMELCSLSGSQAKGLLQRLRDKHPQLKLVGEKRGAHYVWDDPNGG